MEDVLTTTGFGLAQKNVKAYFQTHDVQYVTDDAVFINMGTGEKYEGRAAIAQMLHYIYHVAFDAHAEPTNYIINTDMAVVEAVFVGKHTGDFAGIPATNKMVSVPMCVCYDLEEGLIKKARIYMPGELMMRQLQS